ncbi:MAG: fibronectin type III domain-containing protein [Chloroflexota bacterium]
MNTKTNLNRKRLAWNGLMILALLALSVGAPSPALAATPANDDIGSPVKIYNAPATLTMSDVDFNDANNGAGDPNVCGYGNPGVHTIWYSFTPSAYGQVTVDTFGSSFDTIVAIWTGTPGALQEVACNDDSTSNLQSEVKTALNRGVKYYIEVIQYTSGAGPNKPTGVPEPNLVSDYMTLNVKFTANSNVALAGKYDDKSSYFTYTGSWSDTAATAAYNKSYKVSRVIGNSAKITIAGNQFKLYYTKGPAFGNLAVYMDGSSTPLTTITENASTYSYNNVYTSPTFDEGLHTLEFKHVTKYVNIDAIEVIAPPDLVPPGTITDLAAETGSSAAYGNVNLTWTATGDDGEEGVASFYDVRYSASPITDDTAWAAATKVTTGVPSPNAAGAPESMTVTGLTPGGMYYFAIRAEDEASPDPTPGGLSNSPSASASFVGPFGTGFYDDKDTAKWMYVGTWATTNASSAYFGSYRTSSVVGNKAIFVFEGTQFKFYYTMTSYGGTLNVYVDGALETSLNQKNSTIKYKQLHTSSAYALGQHTVEFVHASGSKTYVDAIEIIGPPDTNPPAAISDLTAVEGAAYLSVDLSWTAPSEDATGTSPAASYQVRYSTSPIVDESAWAAATVFANSLVPKSPGQTETLAVTGLTSGVTYYFAVRAVDEASNVGGLSASPSAQPKPITPVGTGTWQNTDVHWIYSGFNLLTNSKFDEGSAHRSSVIGSTATILINVTSAAPYDGFKIEFATGPAYGNLEVWVDGVLITTINQKATSRNAKFKVQVGIWGLGAGDHTLVFTHATGTYVNIDAIIIP